jgi:hypothetical protein
MNGAEAARPNALPGTADRAATIEVRDADGRLLCSATAEQAERLVADGGGVWTGYGRCRHVRLKVVLSPNSRRTLRGHTPAAAANPSAVFSHNRQACAGWTAPGTPIDLRRARKNRDRIERELDH